MSRNLRAVGVAIVVWSALGAVGCGPGFQQVHGKVTYEDGTPVTKGLVVFESTAEKHALTARGNIGTDGSYRLGTRQPGDGAPAGKYRVLLTPLLENPDQPEQTFDPRFSDFKTSGLEFDVKNGANDFPITVSRPKKNRR